jgi:hypothetical protein
MNRLLLLVLKKPDHSRRMLSLVTYLFISAESSKKSARKQYPCTTHKPVFFDRSFSGAGFEDDGFPALPFEMHRTPARPFKNPVNGEGFSPGFQGGIPIGA